MTLAILLLIVDSSNYLPCQGLFLDRLHPLDAYDVAIISRLKL